MATAMVCPMKVLLTGGAGYIGSITAAALEAAGHVPVVLDSLLTGPREFVGDRVFYRGDIADRALLRTVFDDHPDIGAAVHMAARIVVPESVAEPYGYFRDNVAKSLELFDELAALGCSRVVFSSSASVYAPKDGFEVREVDSVAPSSPYARTKLMIEQVLEDLSTASALRAVNLRYFNPIGADPGLTRGIYARKPSHVLGQLVMAARGQIPAFTVTGTNFPTRDGTGIRDYIHVWDLARAHVRALERFDEVISRAGQTATCMNLGTGAGTTVRELVAAFERVYGLPVPQAEADPRPGDAVGAFANVDRARDLMDWATEHTLEDAIASALAWGDRRREVLGYE